MLTISFNGLELRFNKNQTHATINDSALQTIQYSSTLTAAISKSRGQHTIYALQDDGSIATHQGQKQLRGAERIWYWKLNAANGLWFISYYDKPSTTRPSIKATTTPRPTHYLSKEIMNMLETMAKKYGHQGCAVDDILQEILIKLWLKANDYQPRQGHTYQQWCSIVARNAALDYIKVKHNQTCLTYDVMETEIKGDDGINYIDYSIFTDAELIVIQQTEQGKDNNTIAVDLGIPLPTLKARLQSIKRKLTA